MRSEKLKQILQSFCGALHLTPFAQDRSPILTLSMHTNVRGPGGAIWLCALLRVPRAQHTRSYCPRHTCSRARSPRCTPPRHTVLSAHSKVHMVRPHSVVAAQLWPHVMLSQCTIHRAFATLGVPDLWLWFQPMFSSACAGGLLVAQVYAAYLLERMPSDGPLIRGACPNKHAHQANLFFTPLLFGLGHFHCLKKPLQRF